MYVCNFVRKNHERHSFRFESNIDRESYFIYFGYEYILNFVWLKARTLEHPVRIKLFRHYFTTKNCISIY